MLRWRDGLPARDQYSAQRGWFRSSAVAADSSHVTGQSGPLRAEILESGHLPGGSRAAPRMRHRIGCTSADLCLPANLYWHPILLGAKPR
jgi:hypothetical protein